MRPSTKDVFAIDLSFLKSRAVLRRVAAIALACAVAGAAYGTFAPRWYRSAATVVPAKAQAPGLASVVGGQLSGLAAGLEGSLGGADAARIAAVLQSTVVTDAAIERFDLRTRYGERYQEKARAALWKHCEVKVLVKPNLVNLSCEDVDPRFVQELLTFIADFGNQVFRRVGVSSAGEEVRFLESRVAELREAADETSAKLREFQEHHRIFDLDTQSRAVASSLASLESQRRSKELELDYARTFSSKDEPTLQQLRAQIGVIDAQMQDLTQAGAEPERTRKGAARTFPAALSVPQLRADFEKLFRNRKVSEATLIFALERLEAARAEEARNVSTFYVLDPPTVPSRHARPKRLLVTLALGLLGAFVGTGVEWLRAQRTRPAEVVPALVVGRAEGR
jgi:capsule polysaccharide export protein KpsE/RkpR